MAESILGRHRIAVAVWAVITFVVVTFPLWLAQVWPLVSDRAFIDVMRENDWGAVVVGPYYGWICVVIGIVLVGLVITAIASPSQTVEIEKIVEVERVATATNTAPEVVKTGAAGSPAATRMIRTAGNAVAPGGPPPEITVVPYDGLEAVLFVHNTGGDAVFTADAQIIKVEPGAIGHPAPYRLLWRDATTHKVAKEHERTIQTDGRQKLLLAYWESGGDWGKPLLVINGDEWAVDRYRHDPWDRPSPTVTIEVTIKASPPLARPFRCLYSLHIAPKTLSRVQVTEHPVAP